MKDKTLHNSDISGARENVIDLGIVGDGDMFRLLCKASSNEEGWMKSTKSLEIKEYKQYRDYSSDELFFWIDVLEEYMQYNPRNRQKGVP